MEAASMTREQLDMRVICDCCGAGGWYTAPNGDHHLSDPDHEFNNWQKCDECDGTGYVEVEHDPRTA